MVRLDAEEAADIGSGSERPGQGKGLRGRTPGGGQEEEADEGLARQEALLDRLTVKHLPGQHLQDTHGRRAGQAFTFDHLGYFSPKFRTKMLAKAEKMNLPFDVLTNS